MRFNKKRFNCCVKSDDKTKHFLQKIGARKKNRRLAAPKSAMVFGQYQFQTSTPNILSATPPPPPKQRAETVSLSLFRFSALSIPLQPVIRHRTWRKPRFCRIYLP